MRTLLLTSGPAAGESREIDGELVVGREGVDLVIADSELSRRHVALRPVERGVEIEDLGSLNGTFVNGKRISGPLVLTSSGLLKIGVSQAAVEVSLPQATRMAGSIEEGAQAGQAPPGATVARPVPDPEDVTSPDVTVQRPTAKPDVTVQREIAKPDVTVQRPTVGPDVTVQREIAKPDVPVQRPTAGPDVTVQRETADSDDTVQRPVGSAGPSPGGAPPPEGSGGRFGGSQTPLIAGAVILVLLLIVALLILATR